MGTFLKIKLSLILFSLLLLVLIPLLANNFYAPVTYKKWQQLTWDDFQGFAKPFTGWGAGISSKVILEWDSTEEKYVAFAVQNNQRSWRRKQLYDPDYVLNHEQYHFNITEIHARIMNLYLDSVQQLGITNYRDRLLELNFELNTMQDDYDDDGDHGANMGMQRRWEYKIDSMLHELSDDKGKLTDYFSGAEVFFPANPELVKQNQVGLRPSRIYSLTDYGVSLILLQARFEEYEKINLNYEIDKFYQEKNQQIRTRQAGSEKYDFEVLIDAQDTSSGMISSRWIYHNSILYRLSVVYPKKGDGYRAIKDSFINSFKIVDVEDYWFSRFGFEPQDIEQYSIEESAEKICIVLKSLEHQCFYSGPYLQKDAGLLFASDNGDNDGIFNASMVIDNIAYEASQDEDSWMFFVPYSKLPGKSFRIDFGFTFNEDSVATCPPFYCKSLQLETK